MTEQMNMGQLEARLGIKGVTANLLAELGFKPAAVEKRAQLFNDSDYPAICDKLGNWIKKRKDQPMPPRKTRTAPETVMYDKNKASTTPPADDEDEL